MDGALDVGIFKTQEVEELRAKYPTLRQTGPGTLQGLLHLNHDYDGVPLQDSFRIRIKASGSAVRRIPILSEIGGRTEAIAKKYRLKTLAELHRNSDGTACVCVVQEEDGRFPPRSSVIFFLETLAVPYLYGLSYYDRYGELPWGEYSHGVLGMLEFYSAQTTHTPRQTDLERLLVAMKIDKGRWPAYFRQLTKPSGKRKCVCGSGKPFGKCHDRARLGLRNLLRKLAEDGYNFRNLSK